MVGQMWARRGSLTWRLGHNPGGSSRGPELGCFGLAGSISRTSSPGGASASGAQPAKGKGHLLRRAAGSWGVHTQWMDEDPGVITCLGQPLVGPGPFPLGPAPWTWQCPTQQDRLFLPGPCALPAHHLLWTSPQRAAAAALKRGWSESPLLK